MGVSQQESALSALVRDLDGHRPKKRWMRRWVKRSAVAIIVREAREGPEIFMIKRAERAGDPWSGHMAFPGGRMEQADRHGLATAMRETSEEVGIDLMKDAECIGRLSDIIGRAHRRRLAMVVTPYVFRVSKTPSVQMNHEVADTVWVPLHWLRDRANREKMEWKRGKLSLTLPCYHYRGYQIWGLSLMMIDELTGLMAQSSSKS